MSLDAWTSRPYTLRPPHVDAVTYPQCAAHEVHNAGVTKLGFVTLPNP